MISPQDFQRLVVPASRRASRPRNALAVKTPPTSRRTSRVDRLRLNSDPARALAETSEIAKQ